MKKPSLVLAAGTLILSTATARAGVTIVVQSGDKEPTTLYLEGKRMRADNSRPGARESSMILDGAEKRMLILNDAAKTYSEITQEDMKKMRARIDAMRAQAEERMKSLPPEQRKKMEQMMAGMGAPTAEKEPEFKFERLGEKKTVNGFGCEMVRVVTDGKPTEEDCVSPWSAGVFKKTDFDGLRDLAQSMQESFGMRGGGDDNWLLFKKRFEEFPGFPITRTRIEADGTRRPAEEVKSVKRGTIEAAKFAPPPGYTKGPSPLEQMGGMGGPGRHGGMGGPPGMGGPGMTGGGPPHP